MRRIMSYKRLALPLAVMLLAGCIKSSPPEMVDATHANTTTSEVALSDQANARSTPSVEGSREIAHSGGGVLPSRSADEAAVAEIADGADSDSPAGYEPPASDHGTSTATEDKHSHEATGEDQPALADGRRSDGDDPTAPTIVPSGVEPEEEVELNDGRSPSAVPLPESQRVVVEPSNGDPELLDDGRASDAQPGSELSRPKAALGNSTTKPAPPRRKTLADVSESIQTLDKDGDGQLGLYEWPREKLAEFKTLDSNKDGFLTPAEVAAGSKKQVEADPPTAAKKTKDSNKDKTQEQPPAKKKDDAEKPEATKEPVEDTVDETSASADEAANETEKSETPQDDAAATDDAEDDENAEEGN